MTNNELKKIVAEMVLEELNKPDSKIAKLMMNRERRVDKSITEDVAEYIDETIDLLMEHLHLEKKKTVSSVDKELERMKGLL